MPDRAVALIKRWTSLCALALLVADVSAATAPVDRASEIRVAIGADIRGTNPGVDRDAITDDVINHVVEGLVAYKEDMTVGPMLAESIAVSDDGKTYTFALRPGVRFHNGAPLTSKEVKWSWDRILNPQTNWLCRDWYAGESGLKIVSVAAPDPRTVVFTLDAPSALLLPRMASFQCIAAVLHPDSVDAKGAWRSLIGTGPYTFAEWRRGQYIVLKKFDVYQPRKELRDGLAGGKVAHATALRWIIIPDRAAAKAALYAGQVDLLYSVEPTEENELQRSGRVQLHKSGSLGLNALLMQNTDPLLRDVRMRRAIAHAINLSQLASAVSLGAVHPNPSVIPLISPYYSAAQRKGHEFDLQRSRQLLQEAGYKGSVIKLQTNKRYEEMYDHAVVAQSMLKKAGLNVELEVVEWTTQLSNYLEGKFQMMSMGFSGRTDPVLSYEVILGSKKADPAMQWENAEAIGLTQRAGALADIKTRQVIFDQVHTLMLRDVPTLCLSNGVVMDATSRRLKDYQTWPAAKPRLWGVRVGP